ncbi:MAG TPA: hypothetical protein VH744_09125 [Terriglobales bacterium]
MKKASLLALVAFFVIGIQGHAQEMDIAIGFNAVTAPSASSASGDHAPQTLSGGLYPSISGNFFFKGRFGVGANLAWRASRNLYFGDIPYRPLFYDINAVWGPRLGKTATAELMAGMGAESIRIYGFTNCGFVGCTNYVSSNHFLGHFGAGLRTNIHGGFFIRPEAHLYLVNNNNDFSSARVTRFGVSIGYTFAPPVY